MFRFILVALVVFLLIRMIRGIISYLFPPTDTKGRPPVESHPQDKPKEYSDVRDAKFKDLENP